MVARDIVRGILLITYPFQHAVVITITSLSGMVFVSRSRRATVVS
jgi:hypothetical protein